MSCCSACRYHGDAGRLIEACFARGDSYPPCLKTYMEMVYQLGYQDKPHYSKMKELFNKQLKALGCHGDGRDSLDWISSSKVSCAILAVVSENSIIMLQPKSKVGEGSSSVQRGPAKRVPVGEEDSPVRKTVTSFQILIAL